MTRTIHTVPGQISSPELEVPIERNMRALNSFARMATPEYWGIDPEELAGIGIPEAMRVDPASFLRRLHGNHKPTTPFHARYFGDDRNQHYVALTPSERILLPRNVNAIATSAVEKALDSQIPDVGRMDKQQASAERAGIHALETSREKLLAFMDDTLVTDQELMERLLEASEARGLARGFEGDMRTDVTWFREHILEDMLQTLRQFKTEGRSWSQEKYDLAKKAIDFRLFFDRTDNRHITFWQDMLVVGLFHNRHKQLLFQDRVNEINRQIAEREPLGRVE